MSYSPMTEFLADIKARLAALKMPIKFSLPDESVQEPFIVIGTHLDDDSRSAKTNLAIVDTDLQIDIFLSKVSRTDAEETLHRAKACLGRRKISTDIRKDKTIGREVYHLIIRVNEIII